MKRALHRCGTSILLCVLLFTSNRPARADQIVSKTDVVLIFVAVAAAGAVIGVAIYYGVRRSPSITGCARTGPDGLALQNEGDGQTFQLIGDTAAIHAGDRVRLKGKKKKGTNTFLVDKLSRDFGACKTSPANP